MRALGGVTTNGCEANDMLPMNPRGRLSPMNPKRLVDQNLQTTTKVYQP